MITKKKRLAALDQSPHKISKCSPQSRSIGAVIIFVTVAIALIIAAFLTLLIQRGC